MYIKKIFPFLLLPFSVAAFATEKNQINYESMNANCFQEAQKENKGKMVTGTVVACAEGTSTEAKKEINILYKKLYEKLLVTSPEKALTLEESQKSWVKYRNKHCTLAYELVGSPMYYVCPMDLNVLRVKELRQLLDE
jgi:uncharacterized protein YecT (DUF1311 family)